VRKFDLKTMLLVSFFLHGAAFFFLNIVSEHSMKSIDIIQKLDLGQVAEIENVKSNLKSNNVQSPSAPHSLKAADSKDSLSHSQIQPSPSAQELSSASSTTLLRLTSTGANVSLQEYGAYVLGHNEPAEYPRLSRIQDEHGLVHVRVQISKQGGKPQSVELAKTSGFQRLDQAALEAARRWEYPAFESGADKIVLVLPFDFELNDAQ
jgi:TonB family protein